MKEKSFEALKLELRSILETLHKDNDLTIALLTTSFLDACLSSLLRKYLKNSKTTEKLLSPSGALGSAISKLELCYCLDYITKYEYQNIQKIFEIRNLMKR